MAKNNSIDIDLTMPPGDDLIIVGSGNKVHTFPTDTDTLVSKTSTDILTNKTLTSPVINTQLIGTAIIDEDDMVSNTALKVPTQQSVKAYVDSLIGGEGLLVTGWTPITGTFTYASATTINVSAGATSIYSSGDKIRFQNNDSGTYLYCYIVTVANTLLTVVGDTVPNATLTDQYYSKIENPQGFPGWFAWTPTLESGATDFIFTGKQCYFRKIGKLIWYSIWLIGTVTAGSATQAKISLPVLAESGLTQGSVGVGFWYDSSVTANKNLRVYTLSGDEAWLYLQYNGVGILGSDFAAGDEIQVQGFYRSI